MWYFVKVILCKWNVLYQLYLSIITDFLQRAWYSHTSLQFLTDTVLQPGLDPSLASSWSYFWDTILNSTSSPSEKQRAWNQNSLGLSFHLPENSTLFASVLPFLPPILREVMSLTVQILSLDTSFAVFPLIYSLTTPSYSSSSFCPHCLFLFLSLSTILKVVCTNFLCFYNPWNRTHPQIFL